MNVKTYFTALHRLFRRDRAPQFTAAEKELALLRLEQELADFSLYRNATF